MKPSDEFHQELRQRILSLPGVTEWEDAGIHGHVFFVGSKMFIYIHGRGHCDIRLSKADQKQVLAAGKARPHRQAPQAGYVTFIVDAEEDLWPAMDLIWMSHHHLPANKVFCEPNTNNDRATFFSLFRNEKISDFSLHNGQMCCTNNSPFSP